MSGLSKMISLIVLSSALLISSALAQSVNITGRVVESGTSTDIAGAKVALLEVPSLTTTTDANGDFVLGGGATALTPKATSEVSVHEIALSGSRLSVNTGVHPTHVTVDVFSLLGRHRPGEHGPGQGRQTRMGRDKIAGFKMGIREFRAFFEKAALLKGGLPLQKARSGKRHRR